jgi:hypothetical protein
MGNQPDAVVVSEITVVGTRLSQAFVASGTVGIIGQFSITYSTEFAANWWYQMQYNCPTTKGLVIR